MGTPHKLKKKANSIYFSSAPLLFGVRSLMRVESDFICGRSGPAAPQALVATPKKPFPFEGEAPIEPVDKSPRSRAAAARAQAGLRTIVPKNSSRLLYADHVDGAGVDLFRAACRNDMTLRASSPSTNNGPIALTASSAPG